MFGKWVLIFATLSVWAQGASFRPLEGSPEGVSLPPTSALDPVLQDNLNFAPLEVVRDLEGQLHLKMPDSRNLYGEGLPEVPYFVRTYAISEGIQARAYLTDLVLERSDSPVDLAKSDSPLAWSHSLRFKAPVPERFYPGKWIESHQVDGKLLVTVYPVQWDEQTGQLVRLVSAQVRVVPDGGYRALPSLRGPVSLIVTSEKLREGAALLQQFHRQVGVKSEILTVESLKIGAEVPEEKLPAGYKTRNLADEAVAAYEAATGKGYNYGLARRLIQYLWNLMEEGGGLKYVTVLGDATVVPPSYYAQVRTAYGPSFAVTDACYGATDLCLKPRVAVGRLPLNHTEDVARYLDKVQRWLRDSETGTEIGLYGGKAFPGFHHVGEMGAVRLLPEEKANWNGAEKFFRTQGNYTPGAAENLVSGRGRSSFVYYLDHGKGNELSVERNAVTSNQILKAKAGSGKTPFVVSISCVNAAFDRPLIKEMDLFGPDEQGDVAVGVAFLRSAAGAVAYLGSGRPAIGSPTYSISAEGNVVPKGSTYAMQILETFLRSYHDATEGRAGDLVREALQSYVFRQGNDLTQDSHRWSYFNLVFLGDPVLPLPSRRFFQDSSAAVRSEMRFPRQGSFFPALAALVEGLTQVPLSLRSSGEASVRVFRVDRFANRETLLGDKNWDGNLQWTLSMAGKEAPGSYLWIAENRKGLPVEGRGWFQILPP